MKTFFRMMVLLMVSLAIWTGCSSDPETAKNNFSEVQITFPDEYQDKTELLTYSEESKSFTAANGYKSYVWWLDGEILSETTGTNYTPVNLEIGNHSLMLVVTDSVDETYSTTATFKVQK